MWCLPEDFSDVINMRATTSESRSMPYLAHPVPHVQVTCVGKPPRAPTRVRAEVSEREVVFSVVDAERSDCGKYEVTLKNDFGETKFTIHVTVFGKVSQNLLQPYTCISCVS